MKNRMLIVKPFKIERRTAVRVKIITREHELFEHHYAYAVENGNNHQQAARYASLLVR